MEKKHFRSFLIILGTSLFVFSIGLWLMLRLVNNGEEEFTQLPPSPTSTTSGVPIKEGEKYLAIRTSQGDVLVIDPRTLAGTSAMGNDLYALTSLENVSATPFGIIFSAVDGTFAVGLEQEPLGQTRRSAESYLTSLLGVTESDLCYLNIYVGTTDQVNKFYSGRNLGLSFCPNSVELD